MKERTLWLIAARSGSKGILNKNIRELGGKPLLAYRIESALKIASEEDVWVSTDDQEYARISEAYRAKIPFIRPESLATDDASSVDVVLHAMEYAMEKGCKYDAIGLLEPTSPFIKSETLQNASEELFQIETAESIVAVRESRPNTNFIQQDAKFLAELAARIQQNQSLTRQAFKKEITPSGGFYIAKWEPFLTSKSFYTPKTLAYEVSIYEELEIDEEIDFLWAEFMLNNINIQ